MSEGVDALNRDNSTGSKANFLVAIEDRDGWNLDRNKPIGLKRQCLVRIQRSH
jgi:hypothetical protein